MILSQVFKTNKQINNVVLLGEVTRYVENMTSLQVDSGVKFFELKLYAVKFLGQIYDTENTGIDNISITNGVVYCACRREDLKGKLVTVRLKSKGCSIRRNWLSNREQYLNAFNMVKKSEWMIIDSLVEEYVPSQENTFKAVYDMYMSDKGVVESEEVKAYKSYEAPSVVRELHQESHLTSFVDSKALLDYSKTKLEEVYLNVREFLDPFKEEGYWSDEELLHNLKRVLPPDFFKKTKVKLEEGVVHQKQNIGSIISSVIGLGSRFDEYCEKAFEDEGLSTVLSMQVMLKYPYLFSVMFGGLSLRYCDRIARLCQAMGYPVEGYGRSALIVMTNYRSQNDTLLPLGKIKSFYQDKQYENCEWVLNTPIELKDELDFIELFEKVSLDGRVLGYCSWDNIYKESYIIYKMKKMSKDNKEEVPKERIEEVVGNLSFALEPKQREALDNCSSGVVIIPGCAGSGKTTISKCISDAIGGNLYYAAPTGKAARRLSESVGMPVRTLHSLFHLGIGQPGLLSCLRDVKSARIEGTLIIDEAAMINLDVMFNIIKRIERLPIKLIMMGDPNQLQPIGNGAIFRDLIEVFNPIQLEVSRRFAGGSGVGANCKNIVENNYHLEERDDFVFDGSDISQIKMKTVQYFLKGVLDYGLDRVQIATPYVTPKKQWSSSQLNPVIQEELFKKDSQLLFRTSKFDVYKGTKVVHTGENLANKVHFSREGNTFTSRDDVIGVFNGDVGYVVGFERALALNLDCESAYEEFESADKFEFDPNDYVAIVELEENDYVLYQAHRYRDVFVGEELRLLDLAYALTVHKLQGSEYEYVIFPISDSDNIGFVSNEMVYTAISRAKKFVTVVGNKAKVESCLGYKRSPEIETLMRVLR